MCKKDRELLLTKFNNISSSELWRKWDTSFSNGSFLRLQFYLHIHAPEAISAPLMDIKFLRELEQYKRLDKLIAEVAIGKFVNHLYYLTDECIAFSLFDNSVTENTKLKMAQKMLEATEVDSGDEYEDKTVNNL